MTKSATNFDQIQTILRVNRTASNTNPSKERQMNSKQRITPGSQNAQILKGMNNSVENLNP